MVRTIQCTPHAGLPKVWLGFGELGERQLELQAKQDAYFKQILPDIKFVHRDDKANCWDLHREVLFRQAKWFPQKFKDQSVCEFILPMIVRLEQVPKILHFLYTGDYSVQVKDLRHYTVQENPQACVNCPQLAKLLSIHLDMFRTAGYLGMTDLQALAFVRYRALLDAAPVSVLRHSIRQVYSQERICPPAHRSNGYPFLVMNSCDYRPQMVLPAVLRWCGYYRLNPEWISINGRPRHYGEQQFTQLRQMLPEFDRHLVRGLFLDTINRTVPMVLFRGESRGVRCVDMMDRPEVLSMKPDTRRSNYQYSNFLQPLPFGNTKAVSVSMDSDSEMLDSPEDIQDAIPTELERQSSVGPNRRVTRSMTKQKTPLATNSKSRIRKQQRKAPQVAFTYPVHVPTLEDLNADDAREKFSTKIDLENMNWSEFLNFPVSPVQIQEYEEAMASKGLQTTETQNQITGFLANDTTMDVQAFNGDSGSDDSLWNSPTLTAPELILSEGLLRDIDTILLEGTQLSQSIAVNVTDSTQQTTEVIHPPQAGNPAPFDPSSTSVNALLGEVADFEAHTSDKHTRDTQDINLHDWLNGDAVTETEGNTPTDLSIPGIDLLNFPIIDQDVAPEWTNTEDVTIFRAQLPEREKISWEDEGNIERPTGPEPLRQSPDFDRFEQEFWDSTMRYGLVWVPAGMTYSEYAVDLLAQILEKVENDTLTASPEALTAIILQVFFELDLTIEVQNLISALPAHLAFENRALPGGGYRVDEDVDLTEALQDSHSSSSEPSETLSEQIEGLTDADRAMHGSDSGSLEDSE
jgi:hypothetical protein